MKVYDHNSWGSKVPINRPDLWPTFVTEADSLGAFRSQLISYKLVSCPQFKLLFQMNGSWQPEAALHGRLPAGDLLVRVQAVEGSTDVQFRGIQGTEMLHDIACSRILRSTACVLHRWLRCSPALCLAGNKSALEGKKVK